MHQPLKNAASIALDLGSTRLKAALLDRDGTLRRISSVPAPPLSGTGRVRESDPLDLLDAATRLVRKLAADLPRGIPLGIASQRSSFLLWDRRTARPATPVVSWQDRRAAGWCERHARQERDIARRTGLRLSPHYAGPKLAAILRRDPSLRKRLRDGRLLFGTLETFLVWHWSKRHATDLTMAARTLLADPARGGWSDDLLRLFGVPRRALPEILPTAGQRIPTSLGPTVRSSIADQASGLLAATGGAAQTALVNLGTGGFVLAGTGKRWKPVPRYLAGPVLSDGKRSLYAVEGTINGGGAVADRFGKGSARGQVHSPRSSVRSREAFCIPDDAGIGSPHWIADRGLSFSKQARALAPADRRRIVLEGILFRSREILEDLAAHSPLHRVLLSGGLARDPFIRRGLASCLGREIEMVDAHEGTLLGAARLAAGMIPLAPGPTRAVEPQHGHLREKYRRWKAWMETEIRP